MPVRWPRIIRTRLMLALLAPVLAFVLAGCSAVRLAYNHAHEAAWWWLTDYVEFSDAQRPVMRQAMVQVHAWHRRTQLPAYADMLVRWQPQMQADLNAGQVCGLFEDVMAQLQAMAGLVDALEPGALQALAGFAPAQLAEMERRMAKSNREFREKYLDVTPQALAAERLKQGVSRAEMLYGRLEPEQRRVLEAALARAPWDVAASYERRLKRQQEIVQALRAMQGAAPDQVRPALRTLLQRSVEPADAADRAAMLVFRRQSCQVLAELHQSTTPAQRAKAVDTLRRYVADFRVLSQPG